MRVVHVHSWRAQAAREGVSRLVPIACWPKGGGSYPKIYNANWGHYMPIQSQNDNSFELHAQAAGSDGISAQYNIPWEEWVMVTFVGIEGDSTGGNGINRKARFYINGQLTYSAENLSSNNCASSIISSFIIWFLFALSP